MEHKIYQKPAMKVLETEKIMFEPGGGLSEATPVTPGVGNAKEFDDDAWSDNDGWGTDGGWNDSDETL